MLGVSLRVSLDLDLANPIQKYIQQNYSAQEATSVERAVIELNIERQRLLQALGRNEADIGGCIELFHAWYSKLNSLANHFPFAKDPPPPISLMSGIKNLAVAPPKITAIRVLWSWSDAFRHSNRVSDYDMNFEKSSILFNIGALLSRQATQAKNAAGPDAVKNACTFFQQAAGVFQYMASSVEVMTTSRLSIDLTPDVLSMLNRLMMAQAQACFFEKAVQTVSPKIVSKIAIGTAELFRQAYQLCEKPNLKPIWALKDVYNWGTHCYYQMNCYTATSNYWLAKGLLADDEYGLEIAHLQRSLYFLGQARTVENSLIGNLGENRNRLEQTVRSRLAAAIADNDKIYYKKVPDPNSLRESESIINVKPTPFTPRTEVSGGDPFSSFVKPQIREVANLFQTRALTTVQTAVKAAQEASDFAKQFLQALNLPASLESLELQKGLPENIWNSVREIQYKGNVAHLTELAARINSAASEAENYRLQIIQNLTKEKEDDSAMRNQFLHKWNRRPSPEITANLYVDLESITKLINEAKATDFKVKNELDSTMQKMALLQLSREDLEKRLPAASADGTTNESQAVKTLLNQLNLLLEDRSKCVNELQAAGKLDIIPTLLQHAGGQRNQEDIFNEELAKLIPFTTSLEKLQAQQEELLPKIDAANSAFTSTRRKNDVSNAREKILQEINEAVNQFTKLLAHFNEGLKFYNDLMVQKIRVLKQRVDDFITAREFEKRMIFDQLTKDSAGFRDPQAPMPLANNPNLQFDNQGRYGGNLSNSNPAPYVPLNSSYNPSANPNANANVNPPSSTPSSSGPAGSGGSYQSMFGISSNNNYSSPTPATAPTFDSSRAVPLGYNPHAVNPGFNPSAVPPSQAPYAAPPSQAPFAAPQGDAKWSCRSCTYENPSYAPKCSMCDTPKPY